MKDKNTTDEGKPKYEMQAHFNMDSAGMIYLEFSDMINLNDVVNIEKEIKKGLKMEFISENEYIKE